MIEKKNQNSSKPRHSGALAVLWGHSSGLPHGPRAATSSGRAGGTASSAEPGFNASIKVHSDQV